MKNTSRASITQYCSTFTTQCRARGQQSPRARIILNNKLTKSIKSSVISEDAGVCKVTSQVETGPQVRVTPRGVNKTLLWRDALGCLTNHFRSRRGEPSDGGGAPGPPLLLTYQARPGRAGCWLWCFTSSPCPRVQVLLWPIVLSWARSVSEQFYLTAKRQFLKLCITELGMVPTHRCTCISVSHKTSSLLTWRSKILGQRQSHILYIYLGGLCRVPALPCVSGCHTVLTTVDLVQISHSFIYYTYIYKNILPSSIQLTSNWKVNIEIQNSFREKKKQQWYLYFYQGSLTVFLDNGDIKLYLSGKKGHFSSFFFPYESVTLVATSKCSVSRSLAGQAGGGVSLGAPREVIRRCLGWGTTWSCSSFFSS